MADYIVSGLTNPLGDPPEMHLQDVDSPTIQFPIELAKQGGIGFQFEGGIITVTADSQGVDVSFDRPMIYNGDYAPPGSLNPFNIGPPSLFDGNRALDIPIIVNEPTIVFQEISPQIRQIVVVFTAPVYLSPTANTPAAWVISTVSPGAVPVNVLSVVASGNAVYITTSEHTTGHQYTLTMPSGISRADNGNPYQGGLVKNYLGLGDAPFVAKAQVIDSTTIVLTFNEEVKESEARNIANYSVSPTLSIQSVTKVNSTIYRVTVLGPILPVIYTVSISNISDNANNYI